MAAPPYVRCMSIHNNEIADIFKQYAALLEITGANPFRIRAYRNAARTVNALPQSIVSMLASGKDLTELPGIGDDLAGKIRELAESGDFAAFKKLRGKLPSGLTALYAVPGLGPKRIRQLYQTHGIDSIPTLIKAAEAGKLVTLPRFSKKIEAKILEACKQHRASPQRFKLVVAEQIAEPLLNYLHKSQSVEKTIIAGSYRRRAETVGDLDILATAADSSKVIEHFVYYEEVTEVLSRGETRSAVILRSGMQVDLRVVPEASYGAALHYFTGSRAHNIAVRKMGIARGLKVNEYGIFKDEKSVAGRTEEEIYRFFNMPVIEPELRENLGEIEAALAGTLPKLVTPKDIRGDLHIHTSATDGYNTLEEMALVAKLRGYEYIAITDHTKHVTIAHGQDAARLSKQCDAIDALNEKLKGIRILKSAEVDILEDGSLDLPNDVLQRLDLTVCSVHYKFNLSADKQTERIIRAMDNRYFTILAHPTGRLINEREPYPLDMERVMKGALERGCFLELNAFPDRLDINDVHCRMAKEMGLKIAISTDAHHTNHLDYMRFGINQARRGWLEPENVLNTRTLTELRKLLNQTTTS